MFLVLLSMWQRNQTPQPNPSSLLISYPPADATGWTHRWRQSPLPWAPASASPQP